MKNIRDAITQFEQLKQEISEYFDTEIYVGFDDMTHVKSWSLTDDEIIWIDIDNEEYACEIYGKGIWRKSEFTLVRYDNDCGELIHAVFDNSTEIK